MPQRPSTLARRLRSAWAHRAEPSAPGEPDSSTARDQRGSDFAARLRAAVTARH